MSSTPSVDRPSFAVLGSGAVGGFYGGLLAKAGFPVHFLFHSDYQHVQTHGLRVDSKLGDFHLPRVQAYARAADMPACDVVLIALKSTHNHLLPQLLPPVLKPGGVALLLQNGLGLEDELAAIIPPAAIMGGVCFLCSNKVGPGHIHHLDYGAIGLADYPPSLPAPTSASGNSGAGITPRMEWIAGHLRKAGIEIQLFDNLGTMRWRKLVWNIPYNGLSVALDATTDQLMKIPGSRSLVESLMREVLAGAKACGHVIPDDFVKYQMDITDRMTTYRTSMKIDFDEQRPMELRAIFANPLRYASNAGTALPRIEMLHRELVFLEERRKMGVV